MATDVSTLPYPKNSKCQFCQHNMKYGSIVILDDRSALSSLLFTCCSFHLSLSVSVIAFSWRLSEIKSRNLSSGLWLTLLGILFCVSKRQQLLNHGHAYTARCRAHRAHLWRLDSAIVANCLRLTRRISSAMWFWLPATRGETVVMSKPVQTLLG